MKNPFNSQKKARGEGSSPDANEVGRSSGYAYRKRDDLTLSMTSVNDSLPEIPTKSLGTTQNRRILAPPTALENTTGTCVACGNDLAQDPSGVPLTSSCKHLNSACVPCVQKWISAQLSEHGWNKIKCVECKELMSYDDVKRHANSKIFEKFDRQAALSVYNKDPNFVWCRNAKCGAGQVHEDGANNPMFQCGTCGQRHCIKHKVPWHVGETCAAFERRMDGKAVQDEAAAMDEKTAWLIKAEQSATQPSNLNGQANERGRNNVVQKGNDSVQSASRFKTTTRQEQDDAALARQLQRDFQEEENKMQSKKPSEREAKRFHGTHARVQNDQTLQNDAILAKKLQDEFEAEYRNRESDKHSKIKAERARKLQIRENERALQAQEDEKFAKQLQNQFEEDERKRQSKKESEIKAKRVDTTKAKEWNDKMLQNDEATAKQLQRELEEEEKKRQSDKASELQKKKRMLETQAAKQAQSDEAYAKELQNQFEEEERREKSNRESKLENERKRQTREEERNETVAKTLQNRFEQEEKRRRSDKEHALEMERIAKADEATARALERELEEGQKMNKELGANRNIQFELIIEADETAARALQREIEGEEGRRHSARTAQLESQRGVQAGQAAARASHLELEREDKSRHRAGGYQRETQHMTEFDDGSVRGLQSHDEEGEERRTRPVTRPELDTPRRTRPDLEADGANTRVRQEPSEGEQRRRNLEREAEDPRQAYRRRREEEQQGEEAVQQTSKQCPDCGWSIQKIDGCEHMKCAQCYFEFCWLCGADYDAIREHGNELHCNYCKYFAAPGGVDFDPEGEYEIWHWEVRVKGCGSSRAHDEVCIRPRIRGGAPIRSG